MELTIDQAAVQLGKSARQVRYLIESGRLAATKVEGRWRIASRDLNKSAAQNQARQRKRTGLKRAVEEALEIEDTPRRYSVLDLKAFQLALPLYQKSLEQLGPQHPASLELRKVLELLSRGCHRYSRPHKADAYREARDAASQAVCELVLAGEAGEAEAHALRHEIEQDLMAALAGLLRRVEARGRS